MPPLWTGETFVWRIYKERGSERARMAGPVRLKRSLESLCCVLKYRGRFFHVHTVNSERILPEMFIRSCELDCRASDSRWISEVTEVTAPHNLCGHKQELLLSFTFKGLSPKQPSDNLFVLFCSTFCVTSAPDDHSKCFWLLCEACPAQTHQALKSSEIMWPGHVLLLAYADSYRFYNVSTVSLRQIVI